MAVNTGGKTQPSHYHPTLKSNMANFIIDNLSVAKTVPGFCMAYLTMTKTKLPPIPGVKNSLLNIHHPTPKSNMADFVIDNFSITKP